MNCSWQTIRVVSLALGISILVLHAEKASAANSLCFSVELQNGNVEYRTMNTDGTSNTLLTTISVSSKTATMGALDGKVFIDDDVIDSATFKYLYSLSTSGGSLQNFQNESTVALPSGFEPEVELVAIDAGARRVHWLLEGENSTQATVAKFRHCKSDGTDVQTISLSPTSFLPRSNVRVESFAVYQGTYYFFTKTPENVIQKLSGNTLSNFLTLNKQSHDQGSFNGVAISFDPTSNTLCYLFRTQSFSPSTNYVYLGCIKVDGTGHVYYQPISDTSKSQSFSAVNSRLFYASGNKYTLNWVPFPTSANQTAPSPTAVLTVATTSEIKATGVVIPASGGNPSPSPASVPKFSAFLLVALLAWSAFNAGF